MSYPQHDKLRKVQGNSQAIGEFCDWLADKGVFFAMYSDGFYDGQFPLRVSMDIDRRLAEFYDIDRDALEEEKRHMLRTIREVAS